MPAFPYVITIPVNSASTMKEVGVIANRGGSIVVGSYLTNYEPFKYLYVGTGGDLTVELTDGSTVSFSSVPGGTILPIMGLRVTTATASNITWMGGQMGMSV